MKVIAAKTTKSLHAVHMVPILTYFKKATAQVL